MSHSAQLATVASVRQVRLRYRDVIALDGIDLDIPAGRMVGLIGPDGVGKSSLLSLLAGVRIIQEGTVEVLGGDMASKAHRKLVCPRIAYMPQGLGKNLYPTLSVEENLQFFARLFGHDAPERRVGLLQPHHDAAEEARRGARARHGRTAARRIADSPRPRASDTGSCPTPAACRRCAGTPACGGPCWPCRHRAPRPCLPG